MPVSESPWPHAPPHKLGDTGTFFVTASTYGKEHYFRGRERLAVLHRGLLKMAGHYGWALEAWAVFSNHYHFVARSPRDASTLRPMLRTLHARLSGWVNKLDAAPGRKVWFQYRETLLTFEKSWYTRLNYVHQNAVHHGLVPVANQYPWCSAGWFERSTDPAMLKTIYGFKTDKVSVEDEFHVSPDW
jgi:putative transposase